MIGFADLAKRPDFALGSIRISPSRRYVSGSAGERRVEPKVMQVLLLLLDARGELLTRQQLFDEIWGGVMVGDDSLNRPVALARKAMAEVAPGELEIETIRNTGYRVTGPVLDYLPTEITGPGQIIAPSLPMSRRLAIAGVGAVSLAAIGTTIWWPRPQNIDPRAGQLVSQARRLLVENATGDQPEAVKMLREATKIDPAYAAAWGMLALALGRSAQASRQIDPQIIDAVDKAAKTAREIDPDEPHAGLAIIYLQRGSMEWARREDEFRNILKAAPENVFVLDGLGQLLGGVGRTLEASKLGERVLAIEPLSPEFMCRQALRLWSLGKVPEADQFGNRAFDLWPDRFFVRMTRLLINAFTDRVTTARVLVNEEKENPILLAPDGVQLWRLSLDALETRSSSALDVAEEINVAMSQSSPALAAYSIIILSALDRLDAAFAVADGFLLGRGKVIVQSDPLSQGFAIDSPAWRNSFGLFTPPTKAMRLDPRFDALSKGLGLADYWRQRGVRPDQILFEA